MYEFHRDNGCGPLRVTAAILSPDVPVFRDGRRDGVRHAVVRLRLSDLAPAPYASGDRRLDAEPMLRGRIRACWPSLRAYEYESLVLGAWGCGRVREWIRLQNGQGLSRMPLEGEFAGSFKRIRCSPSPRLVRATQIFASVRATSFAAREYRV